MRSENSIWIDGHEILVGGRLFKIARLEAEYYDSLDRPEHVLRELKAARPLPDLFTFLQDMTDRDVKYTYRLEWDRLAVLPLKDYEHWWKVQLNDKTRNMVRKAGKSGVELRMVDLNDDFVAGVVAIYNESPMRQGKPFAHYGMDAAGVLAQLATFPGRSDFIGAFCGDELIGFAKLVQGRHAASLMHIISMNAHRNKAPTNAIIAKAVKVCSERGVPFLHYGVWTRRGLGAFKKHHGFQCFQVPRYLLPLTLKGRLALTLRLHRRLSELLPENVLDAAVRMRSRWAAWRYGWRRA